MSHSILKMLPVQMAVIPAALAFVTQPAFGVPDHQLVLTENSSSSLMVTFDGTPLSVTLFQPDIWIFTDSNILALEGPAWLEPGASASKNILAAFGGGSFSVSSDLRTDVGFEPNGFTFVGIYTDIADGIPIDVTFNDNAIDFNAAPDAGTTASLLGVSLASLAFLRRRLR